MPLELCPVYSNILKNVYIADSWLVYASRVFSYTLFIPIHVDLCCSFQNTASCCWWLRCAQARCALWDMGLEPRQEPHIPYFSLQHKWIHKVSFRNTFKCWPLLKLCLGSASFAGLMLSTLSGDYLASCSFLIMWSSICPSKLQGDTAFSVKVCLNLWPSVWVGTSITRGVTSSILYISEYVTPYLWIPAYTLMLFQIKICLNLHPFFSVLPRCKEPYRASCLLLNMFNSIFR